MKTSLVLVFAVVVCVAICGGYAKASIIPLGAVVPNVVVLAPAGSAAEVAAREAAEHLANGLQEAGNQAVARAQVVADAACVQAQAVVDAVQAANEKVAENIAAVNAANAAALAHAHAHAHAHVIALH